MHLFGDEEADIENNLAGFVRRGKTRACIPLKKPACVLFVIYNLHAVGSKLFTT